MSNTISAYTSNGITLSAGGAYQTPFTVTATGTINTQGSHGVYSFVQYPYVLNQGTISAHRDAVELPQPGTVINAGSVNAYAYAVNLEGGGTVSNTGTISAHALAVNFNQGGTLENAGNIISYSEAVGLSGSGVITNTGTIAGIPGYGIAIRGSSTITNAGAAALISGNTGIRSDFAPVTIINSGSILGGFRAAISDDDGGSIYNYGAASRIQGDYFGVYAQAATTITNAGTIAGVHAAVKLLAGGDLVVAEAGGVFLGALEAAGTGNSLELQGAGSFANAFSGFQNLAFNPGAAWTIAGDAAELAAVSTITGFAASDTIDLTGFAATSASYTAGIGLVLSSASASYLLSLGADTPDPEFGFIPDGNGGTEILAAATNALGTYHSTGVALSATGPYLSPFTVTATGTIAAGQYGVYSGLAEPFLLNEGTIEAAIGRGVALTGGGTVTNAGTASVIAGGQAGVIVYNGAASITNAGTISGAGYQGVRVNGGGAVTNTGTISGGDQGVLATNLPVSVTNSGEITGGTQAGIFLGAGGGLANTGLSAIILGGADGVAANEAATIGNTGTIIGSGADGIVLFGGSVANAAATALIQGGMYGVYGATSITNAGTIAGGVDGLRSSNAGASIGNAGTITGASTDGVYLVEGGTLTNTGPISVIYGGEEGVRVKYGPADVTNDGSIGGGSDSGMYLGAGGTVSNAGTISGTDGVRLTQGGTLNNTASDAVVYGAEYGFTATGEPASIVNAGTIAGANGGAEFIAGGSVSNTGVQSVIRGGDYGVWIQNAAGTVLNAGSIYGQSGIRLDDGGYAGNLGTGALIVGRNQAGIGVNGQAGTVVNQGSINGYFGVLLTSGGTVANRQGGQITGHDAGVYASGGTVYNAGSIAGDYAVDFDGGGLVENTGAASTLYGNRAGVKITNGAGTVVNAGTIAGQGLGGVILYDGGTVTNSGTIAGAYYSVYFQTGGDDSRLVVDPGAVFIGAVTAQNGGNALELAAGTGTLTGIGAQFTGFQTLDFDPGAAWTLAGNAAGLAAGQAIEGFAMGDTIDLTNILANTGNFSNGTLALYENGALEARLDIAAAANARFAITPDGATGIDITSLPLDPNILSGALAGGMTLSPGGTYQSPFTVTSTGSVYNPQGTGIYSAYAASIAVYGAVGGTTGGIFLAAGGTILNAGTITGLDYAVQVEGAGTLTNTGSAALISGGTEGILLSANADLANSGTIIGAGNLGVFLYAGGTVTNTGANAFILGGDAGVTAVNASADVANAGTIIGANGDGIYLANGGIVTNTGTAALIYGGADGVYAYLSAADVTNAGTIAGGTDAIYFDNAGGNTLAVDAGAVFLGAVIAAGAGNLLELASTDGGGTLSGIGTSITGFATLVIGRGANWVLAGTSAGLADGQLIGFQPGDTLDLTDLAANSESFANGTLALYDSGALIATLNLAAGNVSSASFAVTPDGATGIDITRLAPNPHTLSGAIGYGITLTPGGEYQSPFTVTSTGSIYNPHGNGIASAYAASIANDGSVGSRDDAIRLTAGATVTNTGTLTGGYYGVALYGGGSVANLGTASLIYGVETGLTGDTATVSNAGAIIGGGVGIDLMGSGAVTNTGTAAVIGGNLLGVLAQGYLSVGNAGTIAGGQLGIYLGDGGTIANTGAAALISGEYAIFAEGMQRGAYPTLAATIFNSGSITGIGTFGGAIYLGAGGSLYNADGGQISGYQDGIRIIRAAGSVYNAGTITGTMQDGVYLGAGGSLGNAAGGQISGYDGVDISNAAGGVYNAGTIIGNGVQTYDFGTYPVGDGVRLRDGGTVINSGTAATIYGNGNYGVLVQGLPGTVLNSGTIATGGFGGIGLQAGGYAANLGQAAAISGDVFGIYIGGGGGTVLNQGIINAQVGVALTQGTILNAAGAYIGGEDPVLIVSSQYAPGQPFLLVNSGTIAVTDAAGSGGNAVYLSVYDPAAGAQVGTVVNSGTIIGGNLFNYAGHGSGIMLIGAGTIANTGTGALIAGQFGVDVKNGYGVVLNAGTILGSAAASYQVVTRYGTYALRPTAIMLEAGGTVANAAGGTISGGDTGIYAAFNGDDVINSGLITGGTLGVFLGGAQSYLFNAGTISGGANAVSFGAYGNVLAVAAGAVFNGAVTGAPTGANALEFSSADGNGTLAGIGSQITGFNTVRIDPGASWTLTGDLAGLASGQVITGFGFGDEVLLQNSSYASGQYAAGTGLVLGAETIGLQGDFASNAFAVTASGSDTEITQTYAAYLALDGTLAISGTGDSIGTLAVTGASGLALAPGSVLAVTSSLAVASGATLNLAGGTLLLAGAASLSGNLTETGADVLDTGALVNNATITLDPSTLTVEGSLTGTGVTTLGTDSTLDVTGNISSGQTIVFDGAGAELQITATADIAGTLTGAGTIDITDLPFASFTSASLNPVSHLLGITFTGATSPLELNAVLPGAQLSEQADGNGGTLIEEVTCFAAGTRIATVRGEVKVEDLAIGDLVRTLHAGMRPVKWIGTRGYAAPFANHRKVLPVRICAGAIADGIPARDLFVSPGHAICIDDALIHASRLVNGVTIAQLERVDSVTYYHVELENHEVILAEACPAETFLGEYFRPQFHNAADFAARYPGQTAPQAACLPVLTQGFQLGATLRRLRARAGLTAPATPGRLSGYIDCCSATIVSGWAADITGPDEPVLLDILAGEHLIGRVIANHHRADVAAAGYGAGNHGFEFALPPGITGEVTIRRTADGAPLPHADQQSRAA